MNIQERLVQWGKIGGRTLSEAHYQVRLPIEDVARLNALCEIFPQVTIDILISDLLHDALQEIEAKLPYISGSKITGYDEAGDPFYEDIGLTPKYMELVKKHLNP